MKKIYKSTFREIRKTLGRFLGILIIIAVGCAFFTGLKSVKPDMELAGDKYFSISNFMDYQILSNIGFNDEDVRSVKQAEGVQQVEAFYTLDALGNIENESKVVKLSSIPEDINTLQIKEGRLPENDGECVVLAHKHDKGLNPGDLITLTSGTDKDISENLKNLTYEVVGTVSSPLFITNELGTSKIGNGSVQELAFIPREDFILSAYTELSVVIAGANNYKPFSTDYDNFISTFQNSFEALGEKRALTRQNEIRIDAETELSEKETEYNEALKKLEDSKAKFNLEINDAIVKLDAAQEKIEASENELTQKENEYINGLKDLESKKTSYNNSILQTESELAQVYDKLKNSEQQLVYQEKQLQALNTNYSNAKESGSVTAQELLAMEQQIKQASLMINETKLQLDKGWQEYNKNIASLESNKVKTEQEFSKVQSKLEASADKFTEARNSIADGKRDLDKSRLELEDKKAEAQLEFADAERKLANAKVQLEDAKNKIAEIEAVKWFVLSREENLGYSEYIEGTKRVGGLAEILPIMFFMIAALVCLTSMTRMVDEQRTQIGTLKALGYKQSKIAFKYIFYAVSASALGSIVGVLVGYRLIPGVIFKSYRALYSLPINAFPIQYQYAFGSAAMGIAVTALAAYFTCKASLSSVPSALMRPLAPKTGKRLLLERITFLWKRLKFSHKVTLRNIFRYKKRFIMTVFGVGCCCALVISGFGLKDSIKVPAERQFTDIFIYDSYIKYKDTATNEEKQNILNNIKANNLVKDIGQCYIKSITINNGDNEQKVTIIVPEKPEELNKFINLVEPGNRTQYSLTDDSAILTEKLADTLMARDGIKITTDTEKGGTVEIQIGQICENYLLNYLFMSPEYYETVFGEAATVNQILINQTETDEQKQSEFGEFATALDGVSSVGFLSDMQSNLNKTLSSLDLIVWVILISAGLLAFVVLYTLTTININERMREIATIKVLGFYDKEVNSYIFRESYILTFVGILLGMAGGSVLHQYIIKTATVEQLMYYKQIMPMSFLYSATLTFLFSFIVSILLKHKIKTINMVEALKSVE